MRLSESTTVALVAAVAFAPTQVDAIFRMITKPLAYTRVDPLMNPKGVAGHVHDIRGGSRFRDIIDTPEVMKEANCTSVSVTKDFSNYWAPAMYYINPNGTYTHMTPDVLIYYNDKGGQPRAFPDGLRMLSGLANTRDIGSLRTQGVRWNVNQLSNDAPKAYNPNFMPNGSSVGEAPRVITAHARFPSCGLADGSIDAENHFDHMTWPVGDGGGKQWLQLGNSRFCPDSHPISYPEIHMESFWALTDEQRKNWRKGDVANLILSNGDTTGATFHADFVNGWDGDLLQQAMQDSTCRNGNPDECPVLAKFKDDTAAHNCRWEGQVVAEDVGSWTPIDTLPGCNPVWDWKTPKKPEGPCTAEPGFVTPNLMLSAAGFFAVPFVRPESSGDPKSYGGCDTVHTCPVFSTWQGTQNNLPSSFSEGNATAGMQAQVNAAAQQNADNARLVIPGLQNDNDYTATAATKTYPGYSNEDIVITMKTKFEYYCQYTNMGPAQYGMPCPAESTAAGASVAPTAASATAASAQSGAATGAATSAAGSQPGGSAPASPSVTSAGALATDEAAHEAPVGAATPTTAPVVSASVSAAPVVSSATGAHVVSSAVAAGAAPVVSSSAGAPHAAVGTPITHGNGTTTSAAPVIDTKPTTVSAPWDQGSGTPSSSKKTCRSRHRRRSHNNKL